MQKNATLMTREQYVEMLIETSFQEASAMEKGFSFWCSLHIPTWRNQGCGEMWIRQRIEIARGTRDLHLTLKAQGLTMLEICEELRLTYTNAPDLYDLTVERERVQPGSLQYRGNTSDLRQRYTLRVLVYETDKQGYKAFCRWKGQEEPNQDFIFCEQPDDVRVVRDLSTVEELKLQLALSRYPFYLFETQKNLTADQIVPLMKEYGEQLRTTFRDTYGYQPEDSTTPYIPVTIDGPQDHDVYFAKEYP